EYKAVCWIDDPARQLDCATKFNRRWHLEVVAAPDMQRYVAQHKRDAHRKQHLRQVVFSGSAQEEAVDQIAERDDSESAAEHTKREASGVAGNRQSDIAPDKIIGAVRHVHDAHQPKGDRETAGEQKQERGEGNAVDRLKDAAVHKTLDIAMAAAHAAGGYREVPSVIDAGGYRLYGPRFRNSSGVQVQNCDTFS